MKQVELVTADARAALKRVLDSDRTGTYKRYQAEVVRISKLKGSEVGKAIAGLDRSYLAFFQGAFKEAGIDEAALRAEILKILPGAKFGPLLTLTWQQPDDPTEDDETAGGGVAQDDVRTFTQPYGLDEADTAGLALTEADADRDNGEMHASSLSAGAMSGWGSAAVGSRVQVPADLPKLRNKIEVDVKYWVGVFGVGVSGAWVDAAIEIDKPNGARKRKWHNLAFALAPVAWAWYEEGRETLILSRAVLNNTGGGEYKIKARVYADSFAAYITEGGASADADLKKLTVEFVH